MRDVVDGVFGWTERWLFVEESFKFKLWSINHFAASHKIFLWRFDSTFEPWPLPCRDFEAVEFLRAEDVSRTPSPQEGQGISPCPEWVVIPAATLPPTWHWRSLVHEGPLTWLNKPATVWPKRASHKLFHNRSIVLYTVFCIHGQKEFASQNKNVYFKLSSIFTTSCCYSSSSNKNKNNNHHHYHNRSNIRYNKNPLRYTVLDSQEQSFTSVSPIVAEWIVVTVDMCGEAARWRYLRKRPRIKLPGMIHHAPIHWLIARVSLSNWRFVCVCVCVRACVYFYCCTTKPLPVFPSRLNEPQLADRRMSPTRRFV